MHHRITAVRDALQCARRFLDETTSQFLEAVDFTGARRWLDELITTLMEQSIEQEVGHRAAIDGTATQHELRAKLRKEQMEPIAAIAQLTLGDMPQFVVLQLPKAAVQGWEFVACARAMAEAAAFYKETFLKRGLASTFLDDFEAAIATLEEAASDHEHNLLRRKCATQELELAAKQGRVVLRVLDGLVRQAAGDNASLFRAWQSARVIRRSSAGEATSTAA